VDTAARPLDVLGGSLPLGPTFLSPTHATPSRTVADNEENWPTSCRSREGTPIVTVEVRRRGRDQPTALMMD